jgi:ElaB/YqjD/DUF883 family membrane-anchored ribosome-binding protein
MSEPQPDPVIPKWLSRSVVSLLAVQVALLWTHGSLLQRQHDDIQALREDVQALADSLDQDWDDDQADPQPHPARWARHHQGRAPVRSAYLQAQDPAKAPAEEGDPALKKDLDSVRQSEQDAIAKAHEAQEKLSIQANIDKAEAKAAQEKAADAWKPWLWVGLSAAAVALLARAVLRRRG